MSIQRIDPASRYSEAVIVNGLVFCAGMVPDTDSNDITLQTQNVLSQVDALLTRCQSSKDKLVDTTIYLTDFADYAAMNAVWEQWLSPGCAPARATVAAKLADPHWKIEIKITAAQ
ncbi:RidA family protein [Alishewanella sp. SMS8]|uniref:RidA family protein n=1 Tax=Alishewanella sp. SMS8 TaxID=2994676 RepID=UPI00274093B2|nr:RidA family protein [Alishewanella sp. SMS8]MDP4945207.1 RidA family protein [Alishewanella sp.]MDP5205950.1 RidA family protein [Alishewanella sp. SMS9]MDP5036581.1 RidA family protein [Alishewanella sp.]MDP5187770.1 RidA family protein [Alishewanella sp.]MDP5459121.1 RidA family protein [Alishewanella sp. SMS8]